MTDTRIIAEVEPIADVEPPATAVAAHQVRAAFLQLRAQAQALLDVADATAAAARHDFSVAERDAARAGHRFRSRTEADAAEAYDSVRAVVLSRVERLAPGLGARPFDDPAWRGGEWLGAGARYARVGVVRHDGGADVSALGPAAVPALVPLLDTGNVALVADRPGDSRLLGTLHGLLLRALVSAPPGRCEVIVFDPRLRGALSPFVGLRRGMLELLPEPVATSQALLPRLHEARDGALRVAELAGRHDAVDLGDLRTVTGLQPEPYRIFVLLDYPYGVDTAAQAELLRLASAGPRCGVSLLIHQEPAAVPVSDTQAIDPAALLDLTTIIHMGSSTTVSALDGVAVDLDPPPERELISRVTDQVASSAVAGAAPLVEFRELLPEQIWQGDATAGIAAPIGRTGGERVDLQLRSEDPALPNVLIGGASGQGKSNLLLVLLHSIAAAYSPAEVQMYLLDFKEGLEFDRLGPGPAREHWLPHAAVLGLEGDRLFGLAVLRHIDAEFRRRAEIFRSGSASSLASYRRTHPEEAMPRLLLVIDEFQVLVAESDEIGREAIAILETLARRGRAAGIHLVLASQTLSGIDTLAAKERSIFGQFPWRMSLKTEASESEAVLGRGNTAAAGLRFRGEMIMNADYGAAAANRRAVVAYGEERSLDRLRSGLWQRWRSQEPTASMPQVFYGSRPAELAEVLPAKAAPACVPAAAMVGLPIEVNPAPLTFEFSRDPGRTLAVIGDGRDDALGVLTAAALSLAAQHPGESAEFVLLDGIADGEQTTAELAVLAELLAAAGCPVVRHNAASIPDALIALDAQVSERLENAGSDSYGRSIYVLGAGLHRATRLGHITMAGASPAQSLQRIVRDGPMASIFLLGWWNALRVFTEQLGYEVAPLVSGVLFLRAPENDVQAVVGPYLRYQARPHRGLFVDRGRGSAPVQLVPFRAPTIGIRSPS